MVLPKVSIKENGIIQLFLGLLMTSFVILTLVFCSRNIKAYRVIEKEEIETDALFYTESPKAVDAHFKLMQSDIHQK